MNDTEYKISVMKAYLDGKEIEYREPNGGYIDAKTPHWNWSYFHYRIKRNKKQGWVNVFPGLSFNGGGVALGDVFDTKEKALAVGEKMPKRIDTIKIEWEE